MIASIGFLGFLDGASRRIKLLAKSNLTGPSPQDPYFRRVLWQIIGGTRGGPNRARILHTLVEQPYNANQLSEKLNLDYKTIDHHLKTLMQNGLIARAEQSTYGALYFLTPIMENHITVLREIVAKLGNKQIFRQ